MQETARPYPWSQRWGEIAHRTTNQLVRNERSRFKNGMASNEWALRWTALLFDRSSRLPPGTYLPENGRGGSPVQKEARSAGFDYQPATWTRALAKHAASQGRPEKAAALLMPVQPCVEKRRSSFLALWVRFPSITAPFPFFCPLKHKPTYFTGHCVRENALNRDI